MATYDGREYATPGTIERYLSENFTTPDDETLTAEEVWRLLLAHQDIVTTAVNIHSFAYYAGDKIAAEAKLEWVGVEDV